MWHATRPAVRSSAGAWKSPSGARISIRDTATVLDRSPATVRYWLDRYGLSGPATTRAQAAIVASAAAEPEPVLPCPVHGPTRHVPRPDGTYRCTACRSAQVARRRREVKRRLVEEAGGRCALCGYERCVGALHFHHVDPTSKCFGLSSRGFARSIDAARREAAKCVLLCANCHAEVENGVSEVGLTPGRAADYPG